MKNDISLKYELDNVELIAKELERKNYPRTKVSIECNKGRTPFNSISKEELYKEEK